MGQGKKKMVSYNLICRRKVWNQTKRAYLMEITKEMDEYFVKTASELVDYFLGEEYEGRCWWFGMDGDSGYVSLVHHICLSFGLPNLV